MSDAEIETSDDPDRWEKIKPVLESREGKFLEVNGRRAVELGLAEAVVLNRSNLKQRYQLPDEPLVLDRTRSRALKHAPTIILQIPLT